MRRNRIDFNGIGKSKCAILSVPVYTCFATDDTGTRMQVGGGDFPRNVCTVLFFSSLCSSTKLWFHSVNYITIHTQKYLYWNTCKNEAVWVLYMATIEWIMRCRPALRRRSGTVDIEFLYVFRLFRMDAQPGVVLYTHLIGAPWLEWRECGESSLGSCQQRPDQGPPKKDGSLIPAQPILL